MGNDSYINVQITATAPGVTRKSFAAVALCTFHTKFPELWRSYSDPDSMVTDGFATTSREYQWAAKMFSQSPAPSSVIIGRRGTASTQKATLTVTNTTAGFTYTFTVIVNGTSTVISRVNGASESVTTIATALTTLLTAVSGITTTSSAGVITVTITTAGGWFDVIRGTTRADRDALQLAVTTTAVDFAGDLTAIKQANPNWYAFDTDAASPAEILAVAAWAGARPGDVLYIANTADTAVALAPTTDVVSQLTALAYTNVGRPLFKEDRIFHGYSAALLGHMLPKSPGEVVPTHHVLSGIAADPLSDTQITNLKAKGATYYVDVGGSGQVESEGGPKTCKGEWLDIQIGQDWMIADIRGNIADRMRSGNRVPYTDAGISIIEGGVKQTLTAAAEYLINADWSTSVPKAADVSTTAKQNRSLSGVKFKASWQGAITSAGISGNVTY